MRTSKLAAFGTIFAAALLILVSAAAISVFTTIPSINPNLTPTAGAGAPPFDAAQVEAQVNAADPSKGEALFAKYSCTNCHNLANGVGPYVVGLGARAASRRPGYSAAAYLYESILNPNAYIVPGYPVNVMPQNFKNSIPNDELNDLIAWLLTR